MSDACAKVLNTYELLEKVLLCLPFRDLLFSQKISTNFKTTIERSKAIQQKLYLSPTVKGAYEDHPLFDTIIDGTPIFSTTATKGVHSTLLMRHIMYFADENTEGDERVLAALYFKPKPGKNDGEPSWMSMFTTQPPVKNVRVIALGANGRQVEEAKLQVDSGVRFANVVEKPQQWRKRAERKVQGWRGIMFFVPDIEGESWKR